MAPSPEEEHGHRHTAEAASQEPQESPEVPTASDTRASSRFNRAQVTRALFGWRGKRGKRGKSIYFLPQTSKHEVKLVEVNVLPLLFPLPLFRCQMGVK